MKTVRSHYSVPWAARWACWCAVLLFCTCTCRAETTATLLRETSQQKSADSSARYREGALLVNAVGTFERTGDRIAFVIAGGQRFIALENLNLERVADKLDVDSGPLSWTVSGTVTEFRGRYYLLISRARAKRNSLQAMRVGKPAAPSGSAESGMRE